MKKVLTLEWRRFAPFFMTLNASQNHSSATQSPWLKYDSEQYLATYDVPDSLGF